MKNRDSSCNDHWETPQSFYNGINKEFSFDFDPCPLNHNIDEWDGLEVEWGHRNFINPPYSLNLKKAFVLKGIEEYKKGKLCVFLLPVSTSTKLFHEYILPHNPEIRFLKGRLRFSGTNSRGEYVTNKTGQHDSMLIIFDGRENSSGGFC